MALPSREVKPLNHLHFLSTHLDEMVEGLTLALSDPWKKGEIEGGREKM